jgi:hypothetical protein
MFEGGDDVAFWERKISISTEKARGPAVAYWGDGRPDLVHGGWGVPLGWRRQVSGALADPIA